VGVAVISGISARPTKLGWKGAETNGMMGVFFGSRRGRI
jgi:hypothetical protein